MAAAGPRSSANGAPGAVSPQRALPLPTSLQTEALHFFQPSTNEALPLTGLQNEALPPE